MSVVLLWAGTLLEVFVLAGLFLRRRASRLWTLPLLLAAISAYQFTIGLVPTFHTWERWLFKEFVHAGLFLLAGVELAVRVFANLPGARRAARLWLLAVLAGMLVLLLRAPEGPAVVHLLPRLLVSAAWLYMGLAIVMMRFLIPIDPLHDAVLFGLGPYMMLYAATWMQTGADTTRAGYANAFMFLLALCVLARAAWRREEPPPGSPGLVRLLWPWRASEIDAPGRHKTAD